MIKNIFLYTTLMLLILPTFVLAQMSSENFVVEGPAIGSGAVTINSTSTNYDTDIEVGGLYQIAVSTTSTTTPAPSGGGSTGGGGKVKPKKSADASIIISANNVTVGDDVTIILSVKNTDGSAVTTGGDDVVVTVSGANATTPPVIDNGNGTYTALYKTSAVGTDIIEAVINGDAVGNDTDGVSDGKLHVKVSPQKSTPPPFREEIEILEELPFPDTDSTSTVNTLDFEYGITQSCHRAFIWDHNRPIAIYRIENERAQERLAIIAPAMPWFIDIDEVDRNNLQYVLVSSDGLRGRAFFNAEDFIGCTPNQESVIAEDVDTDSNDEQFIDGIYQDIDGSTVPVATSPDGLVLAASTDRVPYIFWNPGVGTSPIIVAGDRLFITDSSVAPTQTYLPLTETGYSVSLNSTGGKRVRMNPISPSLVPLTTEPIQGDPLEPDTNFLRLIQLVGMGSGILMLLMHNARIPFSLRNVGYAFTTGSRFLFGALVFWKKRRAWGTVYDSVTKAPVDPAYVELFDDQGVKQADAITDLDGRYGFLVPDGEYEMKVRKVNYSFPSTHHVISGRDVLYTNLYYGGLTPVSETVTYDVPMDPEKFDWNQMEKMRTKQTKFIHRFDPLIARLADLFYYLGFVAIVWQFIATPDLISGIILFVYVVLFVYRYFRGKPPLYGTLTMNREPLAYAVVRVMKDGVEIVNKVSNEYGRYVALVAPGTYTVSIEARVSEDEYKQVFKEDIKAKKGYINLNVKL